METSSPAGNYEADKGNDHEKSQRGIKRKQLLKDIGPVIEELCPDP